ncbi:MAG: L-histidine N(alpha)-methyltransferase [Pseudomonadota bacterium]
MNLPRLIQVSADDPAAIRAELLAGLAAPHAALSPKFLYDALGARLFAAITELPEYYPTRTEAAIFDAHRDAITAAVGPAPTLVDLGAGNCEKAARLFDALAVQRYVAVDISAAYLLQSLERLQYEHPAMQMLGVGLDFSSRLDLPAEAGPGPRLLFYPGSSIGNFAPDAALAFLERMRAACAGGRLLIGVDLVKPVDILEPAYDDALGVTAAFNRNLLLHLNRLIGTDFALADWRHVAFFNRAESRIEMHLEAVRDVNVSWSGGMRRFAQGERIHTENSYKWRADDFADLLRAAGFREPRSWRDERDWFAVFAAEA